MSENTHTKELPALPLFREYRLSSVHSGTMSETNIEALLKENNRLALLNKQLSAKLQSMEEKYRTETNRKRRFEETTQKCMEELRRKDRIFSELADTFVDEYRRYKDAMMDPTGDILFSVFEMDTPLDAVV